MKLAMDPIAAAAIAPVSTVNTCHDGGMKITTSTPTAAPTPPPSATLLPATTFAFSISDLFDPVDCERAPCVVFAIF